jgi:thiamine pyrophosphokinase
VQVRAIIIAGGETQHSVGTADWIRNSDLLIAADGGAAQALRWGLSPQVVIGDMDSLPEDARQKLESRGCRFMVHPRAKDETDMELALTYAASQRPGEIVVVGALGGRLDHSLANIFLLALPQLDGIPVRIVDGMQEAQLLRAGETVHIQGGRGDIISLLPLTDRVDGVTTEGLEWALQDETLSLGYTRGVSNVMTAESARVEIEAGLLLVLHGPPEPH